MAFNDNPYIKVKLNSSAPEDEGYSEIKVGNKSVWRKPLNYNKRFYITDGTNTVKSYDAISDGGMTFSLTRKVLSNGTYRWEEVLSPEQNNTSGENAIILANQKVIKYKDILKYNYTLSPGYTLYGTDRSKMITPNGDVALSSGQEIETTNDFDIFIRIKPIKYELTVVTAPHVNSYTIPYIPGRIATIQDVEATTIDDGDTLYYGDAIGGITYQRELGYAVSISSNLDLAIPVTDNLTITFNETIMTSLLNITTSQYGVDSVQVYRVAGAVAQEQGVSSGNITNGANLYYGDVLQVTTVAEQGYSIEPISDIFITEQILEYLNYTIEIEATAIKYSFSIEGFGVIQFNGQPTTYVSIYYYPGTVAERLSRTEHTLISSRELLQGMNTYSENYLCYGDSIRLTYEVNSSCTCDPKEQTIIINENKFTGIEIYWKTSQLFCHYYSDGVYPVEVTRTASPTGQGTIGTMNLPDIVYDGDEIDINAQAKPGYTLEEYDEHKTINLSSDDYPSDIHINIYSSPTVRKLYLTDPKGSISTIRISIYSKGLSPIPEGAVLWNNTPLASDEAYPFNIYYGEVLKLEYGVNTGYVSKEIEYAEVEDSDLTYSISAEPLYFPLNIEYRRYIYNVTITCLNSGIGDIPIGTVLYNGSLHSQSSGQPPYAYCNVCYGMVLGFEWRLNSVYEELPDEEVEVYLPDENNRILISRSSDYKHFVLTYTSSTGIDNILVQRTHREYPRESSEVVILHSGDSMTIRDTIEYTFTASTGYLLDINNESVYTASINVNQDVSLSPTAHIIYGTFSVTLGTQVSSITVSKNNVVLSPGDTIYYGDVLTVTSIANTGYEIDNPTQTITFNPTTDGEVLSISVSAHLHRYYLSLLRSSGVDTVSVNRTYSPEGGGSTGPITPGTSGDYVYLGDVLEITYNTKTNYVIPGESNYYATSKTMTVTNNLDSLNSSNETFRYSLSSVYTSPIVIYQKPSRNITLDNEDLSTILINYPDNPSTAVVYDSSKRIRITDVAKIYISNISINSNFTGIESVYVTSYYSSGSTTDHSESLKSDSAGQYYEVRGEYYSLASISIGSVTLNYDGVYLSIKFTPKQYSLSFSVHNGDKRLLNPENTNITLAIQSSKYKGNSGTRTISVEDYQDESDVVTVNYYYKDSIKITYNDITGWEFTNMRINQDTIITSKNYTISSLISNLTIDIYALIKQFTLTAINEFAYFNYIRIYKNSSYYRTWVSDWTANGTEQRMTTVYYGDKIIKSAYTPPYNNPMTLLESTHNNDTSYYITGDITIKERYSPKLLPPEISNTDATIYSDVEYDYLIVNIVGTNINNLYEESRYNSDYYLEIAVYSSASTTPNSPVFTKQIDNIYQDIDVTLGTAPGIADSEVIPLTKYSGGSWWGGREDRNDTVTIELVMNHTGSVSGIDRTPSDARKIIISIHNNDTTVTYE